MAYVEGNVGGSIWYVAAVLLVILKMILSGWIMAKATIISSTYGAGMVVLAIVLAIMTPFIVR
jgi:hypothetical protein